MSIDKVSDLPGGGESTWKTDNGNLSVGCVFGHVVLAVGITELVEHIDRRDLSSNTKSGEGINRCQACRQCGNESELHRTINWISVLID